MTNAAIDTAAAGDTTIVAAKTGFIIRVLGYVMMAAGNTNAKFTDGAAGTEFHGAYPLAAQAGAVAPLGPQTPAGQAAWFETSVSTALVLNNSAAIQVSGHVAYEYRKV